MHWGEYVEDNSFGVHEFIGLCKKIGAEPYLAGNVGSGTPSELRDWVEYCNYPPAAVFLMKEQRMVRENPSTSATGASATKTGVAADAWSPNIMPTSSASSPATCATGRHEIIPHRLRPQRQQRRLVAKFLTQNTGARIPDGFAMHFYENSQLTPTKFTEDAMNTQMAMFQRVENAIIQQRAILDGFEPVPSAP